MIKKSAWLAALVLTCCTSAWSAWSEEPIAIIVPYAAGGLTDAVTRSLTDAMGGELWQPVVVDNLAGAGGKIGMEQLKRAPKDRYTSEIAVPATMATQSLINPNFGIDSFNVFVDSGRSRALAVSSKRRVAAYLNVPTFRELGINFTTDGWVGYVAPLGVPAPALDRPNSAFVKAIQSPAVQRSFASMGYEPVGSSPQEFRSVVEGVSRRHVDILRIGALKLTP